MSESTDLKTIGGFVAAIGLIALVVGVAMPATSTHTSEVCVNDPYSFGEDCASGSVTTPNPLRGPMIGAGVLALLGGIGITLMSANEPAQQQPREPSDSTAGGGFADKIRERQDGSDTHSTFDQPSESTGEQSTHPLSDQVPDLVAYPVMFLLGAICLGIGFGYLGAIVGASTGILFLIGVFVGAIWGISAWYGLGKEGWSLFSISFTYPVIAVGAILLMTGVLSVLGLDGPSLIARVVFLVGIVGMLVGWHYIRGQYLEGIFTA